MKFLRYVINDEVWNVYLVDSDDMQSIYDSNDGSCADGYTDVEKKEIYFDINELNLNVVRHEFFHAAFHYLYLTNTNLDSSNLEEVMCDMIADRLDWIREKTEQLYKDLCSLRDREEIE